MYKLVCITDGNTADGFKLAGIDVEITESVEEAHAAIVRILEEGEVGIIALDQRLAEAVDERLNPKLETLYRPVLVMLPLGDSVDSQDLFQQRLKRLIRRAVGFDVTLRRE